MDVMDRVANVLLGNRGNTYCNACLATNLALASEHEVQQVVTALSDSASFQRSVSRCSLCGREGFVISSNISVVSTGHGGAVSKGSEALDLLKQRRTSASWSSTLPISRSESEISRWRGITMTR
jgi:hypothetical protein